MNSVVEKFVHRYNRWPTEFDPDYLEMLNMSKYAILDEPQYKPHKCSNCGSTKKDGRKYIDFGLEIDWYGQVYLCSLCLLDIAMNVGLFDKIKEENDNLISRGAEIETMLAKGVKLYEVVMKTQQEFEDFYGNVHTSVDASSGNGSTNLDKPENESSEHGITKSESGTTKSNSGSRRTDVPSLADILNSA
jgi:hypothetical protein